MANTFYEVPVDVRGTKIISTFSDEEKATLDTLEGVWIFWKVADVDNKRDLYYAWKSTWPKECRIIERDFSNFFNDIVDHEEREGFGTRSAEVPTGEFTPISKNEESIPQSQPLKDPAFEIEGEPDEDEEVSDEELVNFLHPAWKGDEVPIEDVQEETRPKSRYEMMMEALSSGNRKPLGGKN